MSWQVASFLIVGVVLLTGFAWYERSRPSAQVVALVALLAALAIAGRVAFAAIPNVKPTTDITIFAGYALGPAPGFAVGALTALVSNFWFGQGPWTPWQMAGWGLCGVFGALLAIGGRRVGRFTLAAACGFAGIAYGALLNFSLMATYGGELSLERFLVLESRAVPFDAAHAIGNVVFALIAGPAMVRMLTRFRERFEWRMPAVATTLLALVAVAAILPSTARAADVSTATTWLTAAQNDDGGFGTSLEDESDTMTTGWAMLGLEAAGHNPLDVSRGGKTAVSYLRSKVDSLSSSGDLARTIVALQGAGVNPRSFGGHNLVAALSGRRASNGSFEGWPGTTAFSVIALRNAGAGGGLDKSLSWLSSVQNDDGGWGDVPDRPSNADVTALVMQAMPSSKPADRGLSYLRKAQRPSGGFALGGSGEVNSQSTAWAVQGMIAVGASPHSIADSGKSALDYLDARQASNGHFAYSASKDQTPVWVTAQALVAAAGKPFPIPPPPRTSLPAPSAPPAGEPSGAPAPTIKGLPLPQATSGGGKASKAGKGQGPPVPVGGPSNGEAKGGAKGAPPPEPVSEAPQSPFEPTGSDSALWPGLLIGLLAGSLALSGVVVLGRRYGW
jgi:Prenyltransferase and squalene oxidase repeat